MEELKYPIGKFDKTKDHTIEEALIDLEYFEAFPSLIRSVLNGVSQEDLKKDYREGGWNVQQLVHHLADAHINVFIRLKLALTEDNPTIYGYNDDAWAKQPDYDLDIEIALNLLEAIHAKTAYLMQNTPVNEWERTYYHAGYGSSYVLKNVIALYTWHSKHHLEHIRIALAK